MNNYIFRSLYASDIDAIDIINMRSLFIVAIFRIFLFIVSFAQGYGNNGCGDMGDWAVFEGQCYSCKSDQVSWQSARSSCSQLGANLVTISNSGIQNFLQNRCTYIYSWIGLNDLSNEGNFVWDGTSTPLSYSNWNPYEPSDRSGNENCVHLWAASSYKWNDLNCESNLSYICQKPQDINECLSSPCQHGTCIDKIDSYSCNCSPGYMGRDCDTDVDECQSSPCIHGNCSDLVNEYKCQCFLGYEGLQCQIDIDECSSSPCSHGSCINKVNSYVCDCNFGYNGISCDQFNTKLLFILFICLPIIVLILSLYLSKKIKKNKVKDDLDIFVFPDVLPGVSKPKMLFRK